MPRPSTSDVRALVHPSLDHPFLRFVGPICNDEDLAVARSLRGASTVAPGVTTTTVDLASGNARVVMYRAKAFADENDGAALLWIHGGGLIMGAVEGAHDYCSALALEAGVTVVSVDYRLAPEHPFPAGLDDCVEALEWLMTNASSHGVNPGLVCVGGDSAGGGLAAALAQRVRDDGRWQLRGQILKYPMLDDRTNLRDDVEGLIWLAASNDYAWRAYAGANPDRPYVAAARLEDLSGLPPAWIGVGSLDLFFDEDCAYAQRLRAAGVPTALYTVPGMYHGADVLCPDAPLMRDFRASLLAVLAAFLRG